MQIYSYLGFERILDLHNKVNNVLTILILHENGLYFSPSLTVTIINTNVLSFILCENIWQKLMLFSEARLTP